VFDVLAQAIAGLLEVDVSAGGTVTADPAAALKCKCCVQTLAGSFAVTVRTPREAVQTSSAATRRGSYSRRPFVRRHWRPLPTE
jgi:hypothetical protein